MTSLVTGADGSGFGIENLPLGVFATDDQPRPGVAIGPSIVDLSMLIRERLVDDETLLDASALNDFLAHGPGAWRTLRTTLQRLLGENATAEERDAVLRALVPRDAVTMMMPIDVQDFVDFFSGIEHAINGGKILRPGSEPLAPNYRYLPVGYHGRASTVVVSGTPIHHPKGQHKRAEEPAPAFGPSEQLDIELELAFIAGPGNKMGEPIPADAVREHVYGYVLLNDWSARDIQSWESQPLGPFLAKSFATSISPWLISLDALEPFRVRNREQEPEPLPHLRVRENYAYDISLEILLQTEKMREQNIAPAHISKTNFREMYWNVAQQLAHMTSNGSRIRAGDLFGSGTVSGRDPGTYGSLLELTRRGTEPIALPSGEMRGFLENGDTVILRGWAGSGPARIDFGEVRGTITAH
ncbi:MAG TPA: fumarylacetoacetase [Candidatus Lustribacter sp.]|nr:fumarylacetoacetase [Candidatus Lustribacter sp.]